MGTEQTAASHGIFITFEGGEGTGKSTQVARLAERLRDQGHDVLTTREPGGAPGAEDIRTLLVNGDPDRWTAQSEALLNFAARAEHLQRTIRPALEQGAVVLCDRFVDSTMAYQAYAGGVPRATITALTDMVVVDTMPSLTLVLDLPPEVGLARAKERGETENRYEQMGDTYHHTLRQAFLEIADDNPDRCKVIDAQGTPDKIEQRIWDVVAAHIDTLRESARA